MSRYILSLSSSSTVRFFGVQYARPETNWNYPNHRHMGFELIYSIKGQITQWVSGRKYILNKGEAMIVSPQTFHQTESVGQDTEFFDLLFEVEIPVIYSLFHQYSNQKLQLLSSSENSFSIHRWIKDIVNNYEAYLNKSSDFSISSYSHRDVASNLHNLQLQSKMLEFVYDLGNYLMPLGIVESKAAIKPSLIKLANEAAYLLETHLEQGIQIKDLAKKLSVDRSYLTRCFKQVYGVSPKSYLIQIRIRKSKRLLESTDLSIDELSETLSFSSASHFNRSFQNITGMTPSEFRSHFQKQDSVPEIDIISKLIRKSINSTSKNPESG